MATEITVQNPGAQEIKENDECRENVPPGVSAVPGTPKLKVQAGDTVGYTAQQSGENEPPSETCTFSTPAQTNSNFKATSRLFGLQSALTPIMKHLNIQNKCLFPETLTRGHNSHLNAPSPSSGNTLANYQKSVGSSNQHSKKDINNSNSGRSLGDPNASVCWLADECLPEVTFLDVTCDTTMQLSKNDSPVAGSVPSTPAGNVRPFIAPQLSSSKKLDLIHADFRIPKVECEATNQPSAAPKTGSPCVQNITFNKHSAQSSGILQKACVTNSCPENKSLHTKRPFDQAGTIMVSETRSHDHHQISQDKPSPKVFYASENISQVDHADMSKSSEITADKDFHATMVDIPESIDAPLRWLDDRYFPEITLLDVTRDSEYSPRGEMSILEVTRDIPSLDGLQNSISSSALGGQLVAKPATSDVIQSDDLSSTFDANVTDTISSLSEQAAKSVGENRQKASLEVTQDISMDSVLEDGPPSLEPSGKNIESQTLVEGGMSSLEVTQNIPSSDGLQNSIPSSALGGQIVAEPGTLDVIQNANLSSTLHAKVTETISSLGEQGATSVGENIQKASLEETQDISMGSVLEDSPPSLEPSGKSIKSQTSVEVGPGTHPLNVTRDISSSSDMSVHCVARQSSTSDTQCNTSSKTVTSDCHCEPMAASKSTEANVEELLTSHDAESTSKIPQPSPKGAGSETSTFSIVTQFNQKTAIGANTTAEIPCPQNKTLDLQPSVCSPKAESQVPPTPKCMNTEDAPPVFDQNCSSLKPSFVQNATFDRLQKSTGSTILGETGSTIVSLQNNTFNVKSPSKQNGTITISETSSSDSRHSTLDKPSPSKMCNKTSTPKDKSVESLRSEMTEQNETTGSAHSDDKMAINHEKETVEEAPVATRHEPNDHLQSGLPMRVGLSDTFSHQGIDSEETKANTFNLDDTLDLRVDSLVTSTPMVTGKMFKLNTEEVQAMGAQKKLYKDGPSKPDERVPSDVPANIVCDRKTFLSQPAAKTILPALKAASCFLKYRQASAHPGGRSEPFTSGPPMTRQRTQAEAPKNTATCDAPQMTKGKCVSYNLRPATGSKQPISGLHNPRLSGIPTGIQRAAAGLKPPSARSNIPTSSCGDKLRGPAVTNPQTKISQTKRHALTRCEALPAAKKKKMDASLPSESMTSSCETSNRAKNLKQPTTAQKALPAKTQRVDDSVPASTADASTSCNAVSRVRALKQPVSHKALLPKPQSQGCSSCVILQRQVDLQAQEIQRLKEELMKYNEPNEEY